MTEPMDLGLCSVCNGLGVLPFHFEGVPVTCPNCAKDKP